MREKLISSNVLRSTAINNRFKTNFPVLILFIPIQPGPGWGSSLLTSGRTGRSALGVGALSRSAGPGGRPRGQPRAGRHSPRPTRVAAGAGLPLSWPLFCFSRFLRSLDFKCVAHSATRLHLYAKPEYLPAEGPQHQGMPTSGTRGRPGRNPGAGPPSCAWGGGEAESRAGGLASPD